MAFAAYMTVKGQKQGTFKGESTRPNRQDWIPVLAFEMALASPRDAQSGQSAGKRKFSPVRIVKEWGAASPQALTACATNEAIREVSIEFIRADANGAEYVYQSLMLTNAVIVAVHRVKGRLPRLGEDPPAGAQVDHLGPIDTHEWEEVSFVFQKIEVTDIDGKTSFADDWDA